MGAAMRRRMAGLFAASATIALLGAFGSGTASAQVGRDAPDVRNVPPLVMLLVDTSGSMERLPGCACSTPGCEECLPMCSTAGEDQRNKWAFVLEALTGQWEDFDCTRQVRSGGEFAGAADQGLKPDHFAPPVDSAQRNNGILDVYVDRVKFGLMTFDPVSTFSDLSTDLLTETEFQLRMADNPAAPGGFSYGGPKSYTFPNCGEPHMLDNGARNEDAELGPLVSVGSDLGSDREAVNEAVQEALLDVRPFGGTPVAGMLDDVRHYFNNHPDVRPVAVEGGAGDPYASCRTRYVVLLTDGQPGADMRGPPVNCDTAGNSCPYDLPENIAADLCQYSGSSTGCTGLVDGVFVVGFDIADSAVKEQLDAIADLGGTAGFGDPEGALLADDLPGLVQAIAQAVDVAAPGTTTRTQPAFVNSSLLDADQSQSQINSGFRVGEQGKPWEGVLERQRFECNANREPVAQPVTKRDRFHEKLNERGSSRRLLTVVPNDLRNLEDHLVGEDTGIAPIGAGGNPTQGNGGGGPGGKPLK
ncbi:MAG: hypothetical protein ACOCV4_09020, partial [Myxococcota bacterium]